VQVGASLEQVGGKAMAEHVGIDTFLNPGAAGGCRLLLLQFPLLYCASALGTTNNPKNAPNTITVPSTFTIRFMVFPP